MLELIKKAAANLFPGYFAMVMATGALSIGIYLLGLHSIAKIFLYMNVVIYLVLWFLTLFRLFKYFPKIKVDLTSHSLGPGFFTLVAGTCVLGSQLIIVANQYSIAVFLWVLGIFFWILVMYTFFTAITIRKEKPTIAEGINGAWLIAAVATQSVSILGTLLSTHVENGRIIILFFTLCMFF
ncbi:tellurite resistance/C4-dicarboxylate transporter family protein [Cytobacillus praedii]|nr:tellurite resistance/C4-dicarboxylate transporter family protein [Cytobacillus praedii]